MDDNRNKPSLLRYSGAVHAVHAGLTYCALWPDRALAGMEERNRRMAVHVTLIVICCMMAVLVSHDIAMGALQPVSQEICDRIYRF
jgi:hypothetical protein